jgi:molybdopterin synthase catalytic subunit
MTVMLKAAAFDPYGELLKYQSRHRPGAWGATASFVGTMRDFNGGHSVRSMVLEHYPGMTERSLEELAVHAASRWALVDSLIIHRTGRVAPGDPIVLVAVWAAHRADAFEACRHMVEALKSRAPFWKKEATDEGERWVEGNTPGTSNE